MIECAFCYEKVNLYIVEKEVYLCKNCVNRGCDQIEYLDCHKSPDVNESGFDNIIEDAKQKLLDDVWGAEQIKLGDCPQQVQESIKAAIGKMPFNIQLMVGV